MRRFPLTIGGEQQLASRFLIGTERFTSHLIIFDDTTQFAKVMRDSLADCFPLGLAILYIIQHLHLTETQHGLIAVVCVACLVAFKLCFQYVVNQHVSLHTSQTVLQGDGDTTHRSRNAGRLRHSGVMLQVVVILSRILSFQSLGNIDTLECVGTVIQPLGRHIGQLAIIVIGFKMIDGKFTIGCSRVTIAIQLECKLGFLLIGFGKIGNIHTTDQTLFQPIERLGSHRFANSTGSGSCGKHMVGIHTTHMDDAVIIGKQRIIVLRTGCHQHATHNHR